MEGTVVGIRDVGILVYGIVRAKSAVLDLAVQWQTGEILDNRLLQSAR